MENIDFATLFQGIGTMMASGWVLASARVFLVLLGLLLIYLGWKGILEPMVMIPMGLGMVAINCGTLIMPDGTLGNLFLDPMLSDTDQLMNTMQIDFLQPVYTLTFSNGLIACFVFMGIGTLLDVGLKAYSVVCGSFGVKANAEGLKQYLDGQGYNAKVVYNAERNTYRVIASSYDDRAEATQAKEEFKAKYPNRDDFQKAWLLYRVY